jgi:hypothetical protein
MYVLLCGTLVEPQFLMLRFPALLLLETLQFQQALKLKP